MSALARLAAACGIEPGYRDISGRWHETLPETTRAMLEAMGHPAGDERAASESLAALERERQARLLPPVLVLRRGEQADLPVGGTRVCAWELVEESGERRRGEAGGEPRRVSLGDDLPLGYHRIELACGERRAAMPLIVTPHRCHEPPGLKAGARHWGLMVHLYALRGERHWGIGDFGDLARLARWSAVHGAATIGINPLHAVSPLGPDPASPYFPSSRLFLNPAYLVIPALPEFERSGRARRLLADSDTSARLAALRTANLTDHAGAAAIKYRVLDALYRDFRERGDAGEEAAFESFRRRRGRRLDAFATWEALAEEYGTPVWRDWPAEMRDPASRSVARFARDAAQRVGFRAWLQWLCARQLEETRTSLERGGLALGLYGDMALGVDPMGADAWYDREVYTPAASLGAPPDDFSPEGQAWGVAAPLPEALRREGYASFIAALRANMAHADILRLDHVMALQRAFWVPAGMHPREGTYVRYPLDDLLGIVALESRRAGTVVIGEDLGTVDPALRRRLAEADILSYRVLWFEKEDGRIRPPEKWPRRAVACAGTHDLPPLAGFREGCDIVLRRALGLFGDESLACAAERRREDDRRALAGALVAAGLLGDESDPDPDRLRRAVHRLLARTPSWLVAVQIDDLAGEPMPLNLPGTVSHYPNWKRRLHRTIEALLADEQLAAELAEIAAERKAGALPSPDSGERAG